MKQQKTKSMSEGAVIKSGGDLRVDWKSVRLGEINTAVAKSINPAAFPDETFEYYSIPAFQEFSAPVLARGNEILSNKILVGNGTVMFGKLNPRVLKVWLVNSSSPYRKIASTEFLPILPNSEAIADFIYYFCQSPGLVAQANQLVSGSTPSRERVDKKSFFEILVPLPPLPEQRAIAYVLYTLQQAKKARQCELVLERERKAALTEYLFTHGTCNESLLQTRIGQIPETWKAFTLAEIGSQTQYGISLRGNATGAIPILRMNNLQGGRISVADLQFVDLDQASLRTFRLNKGDLLFNRTNSFDLVGKVSLFDLEGDFVFASYLVRLVVDPHRLFPPYLNYFLNWGPAQQRLRMLATRGVSQSNINASKLRGFVVPVPELGEQYRIARLLSACDTKIAALDHEAQLLDELFRAMLEELMTGQLSAKSLIH